MVHSNRMSGHLQRKCPDNTSNRDKGPKMPPPWQRHMHNRLSGRGLAARAHLKVAAPCEQHKHSQTPWKATSQEQSGRAAACRTGKRYISTAELLATQIMRFSTCNRDHLNSNGPRGAPRHRVNKSVCHLCLELRLPRAQRLAR